VGQRRGGFPTGVGRHGEGGESDKWGPIDRETRERRLAREGVIQKEKRIFREDATDARAGWADRDDFWKVFHMYYKLICILYALLCGQKILFL
jgi:hypothetical protein